MFCKKCGSIMLPQKSNGKTVLVCRCGYKEEGDLSLKSEGKKMQKVEVVEKEEEIYPIEESTCPKCRHNKAYAWEVQTRSADEPATRFYKCTKCKHTWREYR